jgi:hypothetical protein
MRAAAHQNENREDASVRSGTWKAVIRKPGWPTVAKTFRSKRDADDWSRRTEDEMVRGAFVQRASGDRLTLAIAMNSRNRNTLCVTIPELDRTRRHRIAEREVHSDHLGSHNINAQTF